MQRRNSKRGRCRIGNLISAADVFVDRDILRFAGAEPITSLEGELIAGFLNVKPPSLATLAGLLREGKYGEVADLMAEAWATQFEVVLTDALEMQVKRSGIGAVRSLERDGFGVEELTAVATEPQSFGITAPTFDPTDPRVLEWVTGRTGTIVSALGDDAREVINSAITRGAAEQLSPRQVARVIQQHVGLDARRATAVENYRTFVYDFRDRKDIERVIKRRPRTVKERLQRGGFKRKEWRIIREHGAKKALPNRRLDNMVAEYADRLRKERALTIAQHEITMAQNRAKELVWEEAQANGTLLPGAKRKWITRKDERVCKLCGPMEGKLAPVGGVWHTARGDVSTPNQIHPTCRCTEKLIAKPRYPRKPRRHIGARKKKAKVTKARKRSVKTVKVRKATRRKSA